MALQDKRLFLLDMDGTIYLSEQLFDGTIDFLNYVKRIGGRYLYLTNNSSRGTDAYIAKMKRLGIEAFPEDFLTSADAAVDYFRQNPLEGNIYVCGTESLKGQLRAAGLPVVCTETCWDRYELIRENGIVVKARDPKVLAAAMARVPELDGEKGRGLAAAYSTSRWADCITALVQELTNA